MKKRKNKKLVTLLALSTAISVAPNMQTEVAHANELDFTSKKLADGTMEITGYVGTGGDVVIPNTLGGSTVTSIGVNALRSKKLTSITIPSSVTSIGEGAFYGNLLSNLTIPSSVTSIGKSAFGSNQLANVTIPNSVKTIGYRAFENNKISSVTIPNGVTTIEEGVFVNNDLTNVTIPEGVTSIGRNAFYGNQITKITIPNTVTSIGNGAFAYNGITDIVIPNNVTSIGDLAFYYNRLTNLTIPKNVQSIGNDAFSSNGLKNVAITNNMLTIGENAFEYNSSSLTLVGYNPSTAKDHADSMGFLFVDALGSPTLTPNNTALTTQDVSVTITYPNFPLTKQYRINGGAWTTYTGAITMTANGKIEARGIDETGKSSSIGSYDVSNIDKTAPTSPSFSPSTTSPTNQNVSVTVNYPSDATTKQYRVNGGSWYNYSSPISMSSNGTVEARAMDQTGNTSAISSYNVTNIDKVAPTKPTIVPDKTYYTNENVVVTVTFPSDAVVKEYSTDGGFTWSSYTSPITMTANGTVKARATDSAGNVSPSAMYTVYTIDKTPPGKATLSASTTSPTNEDVSVTIIYPSDAKVKEYKIGATGTWTVYTTPVVLSSNDTVYARSQDLAGNYSVDSSLDVNNIDKTAPTAPTVSADKTSPTNTNVILTATFPSDATEKEYSLDGGNTWSEYTGSVTFTSNDTFQARAKDSAGNYSSVATYTVSNIDKTAPINATFVADKTAPTNTDVKVTINYPADASVKQYKIGSTGAWTTYSTPVVVSANNTVYARSYDAVGNISSESSYVVNNIDKIAPTTPTISADNTNPTNGNVVLTASFPVDSSVKEYSLNDGAWTAYADPITMSSNGKLEVRAKDSAGNYSAIGTYNVTNIDKTPPANATLTPSITEPTNGNVNITINYPADATVKQYKVGSTGTWTNYTTPVVVSANNTVYARSYDSVGNVSNETNLTVSNIDKTAPTTPTISADITSATNGNVVLTVSYPADAVVKEYSTNGGSTWTAYTNPVTMTSNGTLQARAKDSAGNVSAIGSYVVGNIDKTAPETATLTPSTTAPTNGNVSVTIAYPNDASVKEYKIGSGGTWTAYTTPVVVSSNNTVYARSKDAVGNVSVETNLAVTNIDKTAPTIPTISADVTENTNGDVTLTVSYPSDASVKEYSVNNGQTWLDYSNPVKMTANGTLQARAKDSAGNVSAIGSYIVSNIDKTAPASATFIADKTTVTNTDVNVTISYPSDASVKQYKVGSSGTWTTYSNPVVVSANNTVYARSYDAVGNVSAETSYVVSNIDKVVPTTPTISANVTSDTNGDVVLTASFPSDASVKEYRLNVGSWNVYTSPVTMTDNGKMEVRAKDSAGNYSAIGSYIVSNIDKMAPVNATLTPSTTAPTNQDVSVTINYPSDASLKQYKIGNGGWTTYSSPVVLSGNNTVYARSIDAVGNISNETSLTVSNIDKTAPNAPTLVADKTAITNTDVVVTATFPSDASVKQVKVNDGSWVNYVSPITLSANGKVESRSIDHAGNVSSVTVLNITNIDKTAPNTPTLVADKTNPTNTNVVVTAMFPTDSAKNEVRVNGGLWTIYTSPITMSENGKVEVRSTDHAGNVSSVALYEVKNIDKVAPNAPTLTPSETNPTNTFVSVTATFSADTVVKEVRVNGGSWSAYSNPIIMSSNGKVEVRGFDHAGNVSNVSRYDVTNIDKTAPNAPTYTVKENQNTITLNEKEGDNAYYRLNDGEWVEYTTSIVTEDGSYKVDMKSVDHAGNESQTVTINVDMYRDALNEAEEAVQLAESEPTQENVDNAIEKVNVLPEDAPEREDLIERIEDIQDVIDAIEAIEKALESRNEEDVEDAQEKIDLLDKNNPIIIDIIDEIEDQFAEADILALVAKERYDILSSKYGMSKVAYNSLVQSYYAIKYTGDTMYKMAKDKFELVSTTDKHYALVEEQFNNLNVDYDDFVEDRVQTDAEIKAESSVKVMESNYDPAYAVNTQALIDKVEDATVRVSLQQRLDNAKAKYESSQLDKVSQNAISSVVKAETTKQTYYVTEAYKKVNALNDATLKAELTARLQTLEAQMTLDRKISDATRTVELAEQYKYASYITSAQTKVSALPDGDVKTSLQARLDALKSGQPTGDQATIIQKAKNALSLANSLKTQYYVDKAQTAINLVEDETIRAELQAKLDAIVVKP